MSELTLDDAIKHCLEVAEENDLAAETYELLAENNYNVYEKLTAKTNSSRCTECAENHRQLAEWLMELKDLRAEQNDQYVFIHELMSELAEAKRLLKAAVEDFSEIKSYLSEPYSRLCDKWRYENEALKLIGGSENAE